MITSKLKTDAKVIDVAQNIEQVINKKKWKQTLVPRKSVGHISEGI